MKSNLKGKNSHGILHCHYLFKSKPEAVCEDMTKPVFIMLFQPKVELIISSTPFLKFCVFGGEIYRSKAEVQLRLWSRFYHWNVSDWCLQFTNTCLSSVLSSNKRVRRQRLKEGLGHYRINRSKLFSIILLYRADYMIVWNAAYNFRTRQISLFIWNDKKSLKNKP